MQATGIIHHVCIMSYKIDFVNFGEAQEFRQMIEAGRGAETVPSERPGTYASPQHV